MNYRSVFDIIGPVMVGPSSSHTAGAAKIGRVARKLLGTVPIKAAVTLYGSFAETYQGHGTDVAIAAGLLDFDERNPNLPDSLSIAEKQGMQITFTADKQTPVDHPNTVRISLTDGSEMMEIVGVSIGGGKIEINEVNGFSVSLSGSNPALLVLHHDRYGAVAEVAGMIATYEMNISYMQVSRKQKGSLALMVIQTDEEIGDDLVTGVSHLPNILNVAVLT
ncbi:L-serine ammonia-lyase, iron-sulfur-dependent subunit beta [Sporolactobacillus terrae]|uniref:L-serine deaminase n=1 Tax=Sporolactobacillus terrae TaxID=269673 RepID=A0A410D858_9BACL|nr:L-serine ammonia-lyase, iron-sulfur-dependent subunit beta [Sporolactobacillus terrae]QAA22309.1 L-serine ammonia-lyase, iron-sulfur-dependent, subunit beta [Sporolactobacillus terrae]QAA25285.1 L-serine ammonia-lyase, iron-sulfur-dependent, subunit beta [Sporolactobacillus terrae]UAK17098.1 L-serine ammonia-lyase, iron-sulfur-dependent subunit beta [Sporolactobacillus terrae]BBN98624.1 putative L-serine dehydratase, beta chain [Sporolactobacillus terrae]